MVRVERPVPRHGPRLLARRSGGVRDLGYRLSGSSDLYGDDGRRPFASVNFVTAHDGFTLRDLVTYDRKHNEANGEHNRDGSDHNRSWNHGVEGETDDPEIEACAPRSIRNLLATLLLSTGVPMITAGDEMGRTQGGNNNAYCQDNEVSWVDWDLASVATGSARVRAVAGRLRRAHPVLRHRHFFEGRPPSPAVPRTSPGSHRTAARSTRISGGPPACRPSGCTSRAARSDHGRHGASPSPTTRSCCSCTGARRRPSSCSPGQPWAARYERLLDTADERPRPAGWADNPGDVVVLGSRSLVLLKAHDDAN